jgi:hypothetical protein
MGKAFSGISERVRTTRKQEADLEGKEGGVDERRKLLLRKH